MTPMGAKAYSLGTTDLEQKILIQDHSVAVVMVGGEDVNTQCVIVVNYRYSYISQEVYKM